MRLAITTMAATLVVAGGALIGAAPAFAGADDGGVQAFWHGESAQPAAAPARNVDYTALYETSTSAKRSRGVTAAAEPANKADEVPPMFYHAMGTMGVP